MGGTRLVEGERVYLWAIVAGTVESFDVEAWRAVVAERAAVPISFVNVTVVPASVRVITEIHAPDIDERDRVIGILDPYVGNAQNASQAFGVEVEEVVSVQSQLILVSPPPQSPPAAPPAAPPKEEWIPRPLVLASAFYTGTIALFLFCGALCEQQRRRFAASREKDAGLREREAAPDLPSLQELPLLDGQE